MEQNRMSGIYLVTMGIAEKISDNIESKIRFENENANSDTNITDLINTSGKQSINQNFYQ